MNASKKNRFNFLEVPQSNPDISFKILEASGITDGIKVLIGPGVVFSKYSYETGSFVTIPNLGQNIPYKEKNEKLYLEFTILSNLQVSGALVKCEKIGEDAPPGGWTTYPDLFKIEPGFEFHPDGRLKTYRAGARQTKAYALIGYTLDDEFKNRSREQNEVASSSSSSLPSSSSSSSSSSSTPTWVQILDSDLIMVTTVASGVPCTIPFPYLGNGGRRHLTILKDPEAAV